MMLAGWLNYRLGAAWRARKALSEGHLMGWTNKFTLLDGAVRGIGGAAAEGQVGEAGQQRQLLRLYDVGDERRRRFGVGEGPRRSRSRSQTGCMEWINPSRGAQQNAQQRPSVTLRSRFCHASVSVIGLYCPSINPYFTSTYNREFRTENPCVAGSPWPCHRYPWPPVV